MNQLINTGKGAARKLFHGRILLKADVAVKGKKRAMCQNIIDAQSAEIAQMQDWLMNWYGIQYAPMPMMGDMGMMSDPPMMMGMMAGLNRLEGVEYDIAWAESMIDHHDDAIHMSERLLERIPESEGHAGLRALAQQIIQDQSAEIETLEILITELNA